MLEKVVIEPPQEIVDSNVSHSGTEETLSAENATDPSVVEAAEKALREAYFKDKAELVALHHRLDTPEDVKQLFPGYPDDVIEGALNDYELMDGSMRIAHRMSAGSFDELLTSKRLKNYKETGHSGGRADKVEADDGYDQIREQWEQEYGVHQEGEPELIHGFLETMETLGERGIGFPYGPVELILKEDVMDRAVYTFGDSAKTQYQPVDKKAAMVREHVRNRYGQRYHTNVGAIEGYTEAIVLGGVNLEDIDSVVITMGERQTGERTNAKSAPTTMEELETFIQHTSEALPGVSLGIRIPAEVEFYTKTIIRLAETYPHVQFMATIHGRRGATDSPFRTLGADGRADLIGVEIEQEITERAAHSFTSASDRRNYLEEKLIERWKQAGHEGKPPENISFHLTNKFY